MLKSKGYAIIFWLFISFNLLLSETYYVSSNGNDNNSGTIDNPFATVQTAHNIARAGDIIYLRGGTYMPTAKTNFTKKGNSNAYFELRSYPGEIPVIDGLNVPDGNIGHASTATWGFDGAEYWKIVGPIILTNGRGAGLLIEDSRFLEFDRIESSYNGKRASRAAHGFIIWIGNDIVFNNCDAHHNANHLWKDGENQLENQYQHGDGWRIFTGENIRFSGCRSWRNLDDNYDFYSNPYPVEMEDCWAAYAGRDDSLGTITGVPNKDMPLLDPWDLLWGNGIKLGYWEDNVKHRVVNSLSWGNNGAGFHMNLGPAEILNSASYGNKVFGFDYTDGKKHTIKNSLEFGNNFDNPDYPEALPDLSLASHNSWNDTVSIIVTEDDPVNRDDSGMLGPRREDGGLPLTPFLRLVPGSDLIDTGVDVGLAFMGTAPDIGPFESEDGLNYFTLIVNQKTGGEITPSTAYYLENTNVEVSAVVAPGYRFDGWEGDLSAMANPDTILMDSDKTISAIFTYTGEGIVENLAIVTATASESETGNGPEQSYDNDFGTYWAAPGNPQWISYDLGSVYTVDYLDIAWNVDSILFEIEVSTDGSDWTEIYSGHSDPALIKQFETFDFEDTSARYVRVTGHGADTPWGVWNTIIELDIYGASVTGLLANGKSAIQPDKFNLTSYPNPFNPLAVLRYGLPEALNVSVAVYDVSGRKIAQLEDGYRLAGIHTLTWDAKDDTGRQVASGMYLLRIQAGRYFKTIKLTYIR